MGFFSWKTSDTQRSIPSSYSDRPTFPVHMITEDGQVFTENDYDGYGNFGGKDIYVLIAEMNGLKGETEDETRTLCFDKIWRRGIEKNGKKYYHKEDFSHYQEPLEDGFDANELVANHGWKNFGDSGHFAEWEKQGYKVPKLVEVLPSKENWLSEWNSLPYPDSCEFQGYFYEDGDEETCDECGNELDLGVCYACE